MTDSPSDTPAHDTSGDSALPRRIVRLTGLSTRSDTPFELTPDAAGRRGVADALGIVAVRKLRLDGRLIPEGRADWRLEATLGATVVQDCVVTLDPVTTRIDEEVLRRYLADLPMPEPGEIEMPEDDTVEALPATLDLAEVMIEALALALPPYPRVTGAAPGDTVVTEPGKVPLTDEGMRPFAGLRDLRDKLTDTDD